MFNMGYSALTTEYIPCSECYIRMLRVFRSEEGPHVFVGNAQPYPIITVRLTDTDEFSLQLVFSTENGPCHPVRMVLISSDPRHDALMTVHPDGTLESQEIWRPNPPEFLLP